MSDLGALFYEAAASLLRDRQADSLLALALTHSSSTGSAVQETLATLGTSGLRLAMILEHVRTMRKRDGGSVTQSVSSFHASQELWLSLASGEFLDQVSFGKGLAKERLSFGVRRSLVRSLLGACFVADFDAALLLTTSQLFPHYARLISAEGLNPKSALQH